MNYKTLLAVMDRIKDALKHNGFEDLEVLDHEPGDPIPLAFDYDGDQFVIELDTI